MTTGVSLFQGKHWVASPHPLQGVVSPVNCPVGVVDVQQNEEEEGMWSRTVSVHYPMRHSAPPNTTTTFASATLRGFRFNVWPGTQRSILVRRHWRCCFH